MSGPAGTGAPWRFAVRPALSCDIALIAAAHADCFAGSLAGRVWDVAAVSEILAMPGAYGLLAAAADMRKPEAEEAVAGFLLGLEVGEAGEILSLGSTRAWRRRGAARALLRAAVARASAAGLKRLTLEVAEDNEAARQLYAEEGFFALARRPAYYRRPSGPAASALVLAHDLG